MHALTVPDAGPKLKLVEAAEQLFADKGFEAVSVRDITQLAEANVAAINYHFGSRNGLVAVVMTRYVTPINEERLARLESAEARWGNKPVPVEEIVEAFARPLITRVRKSEMSERLFFKLLGRIFGEHDVAMPPEVEAQFMKVAASFIRALGRSLPSLPPEDLIWRTHFMAGAMIHMLAHAEMVHRLSQGAAGSPSIEVTLARFSRFVCAGLREGITPEESVEKGPQGFFDF